MYGSAATAGSAGSSTAMYRALWRLHFYAGLFCIPFIVWLSVTGSIYLFKPQIDAMIDRPYETLWDASPARSASMQAAAAIASVPGSTFNAYQLPRSSHAAVQVLVGSGSDVERVYVHPRTLRVLKSVREDARFTNRISSLHGELLLGDRGSMLVELAASWGIVMIITGLFLWWPRESRGFSGVLYPRLQQGRVLWRDLHAVGGFWVSLFALFFLVSGLPWAASWGSMLTAVRSIGAPAVPKPDWPTGTGSQLGVRAAQNASPAIGGMTAMSEMTAKMRPNVVDLRVLDRIEPVVAKDGLPYPALIAPPSEASATWTARSDTQDRPLRVRLTIDPLTGAIRSRSDFGSLPVVDRVVAVGVAAHEGQLFSPLNQILDLVTAMALIVVTTSAVVMWWSRRPKGVLGAPRALASPRLSLPVLAAIAGLGVVLPLFGISLVGVVLLERLVLRRIARVRTFLGLRLDATPSS
jgi:uncharacterized iron-regulated membrane protein